tara:strand:- start:1275 stop:1634 length:360 start_codon:yes stop_codon:yes gene_type:complete
MLLAAAAATTSAPPVGAVYERNLTLPVLGGQRVRLRIDSRTRATLDLEGALALRAPVHYALTDDGYFQFVLDAPTHALLRRVRTRLGAAAYDAVADTAHVTVHPPLPFPVVVRMARSTH